MSLPSETTHAVFSCKYLLYIMGFSQYIFINSQYIKNILYTYKMLKTYHFY